ncbi:MAG: hypothetical protein ABJC89_20900, partial [Acidobacteriota bacterium]
MPSISCVRRLAAITGAILAIGTAARAQPFADTFNPGADAVVTVQAQQLDGKVIIGGYFTSLDGGGTGSIARNHIARLNADGQVDATYDVGANDRIQALAVQPDGKILVAGTFTMLGGGGTGTTPRNYIGRLNADGSLDASFNPGADNNVLAMALQADGKILLGGLFTTLGGGGTGTTLRYHLGRLNPDGSVDTGFDPGTDGSILTMMQQADGKILVGGFFSKVGGGGSGVTPRQRIARLNLDGSIDASFAPASTGNALFAIATQADGKILLGGQLTTLGGLPRSEIGRLNADGSVDASFDPGANDAIGSMAVQADGRILLGGSFTMLGGGGTGTTSRQHIARLNADGTLDPSFDPGANEQVTGLMLQADGKILVAGWFSTLGGGGSGLAPRNHTGRLANTSAPVQSLEVVAGGTAVRWSRGGPGPELWRVTFESSTDAVNYTMLGAGSRRPGGWQLAGLNLPLGQNVSVRARGYYRGSGYLSGSESFVESIGGFVIQPCTYALSSSSAAVPSGVNAGSVVLTTNLGCPWSAPSSTFVTVTSDSAGTDSALITWVTAINPSPSPRTAALTIAGLTFTIAQAGASTTRRVPNDFNHDAITDLAVFRPALGRFFVAGQPNTDWGAPGDLPVPGDYDGNGSPEVAVFRPGNGTWYIKGGATVSWGLAGDIPVPGDYNGDRITEMAVFRPKTGEWLVRNGGTFTWGLSGDLPVPADYNGDGITDIAVYRPSTGTWFVRGLTTAAWGFAADIPVPADYNGDGTADIAVYRP